MHNHSGLHIVFTELCSSSNTGADIVGINCHFDPQVTLVGMKKMKEALDAAGQKVYLMCQPLGYLTSDAGKQGFIDLPEFPFGMCICRKVN